MNNQTKQSFVDRNFISFENNPNYFISPNFSNITIEKYEDIIKKQKYQDNIWFKLNPSFNPNNPSKILVLPHNSTQFADIVVKNIYCENIFSNTITSSFFKNFLYVFAQQENTVIVRSKYLLSRYFGSLLYNQNYYNNHYYESSITSPFYIKNTNIFNISNIMNMDDGLFSFKSLDQSAQTSYNYLWDYRLFSYEYISEDIYQDNIEDSDINIPNISFRISVKQKQKPILGLASSDLIKPKYWLDYQQLNFVGPVWNNSGELMNNINNNIINGNSPYGRLYPTSINLITGVQLSNELEPNLLTDQYLQSQNIIKTGSMYNQVTSNYVSFLPVINQEGTVDKIENSKIIMKVENNKIKYFMKHNNYTENSYITNNDSFIDQIVNIPLLNNIISFSSDILNFNIILYAKNNNTGQLNYNQISNINNFGPKILTKQKLYLNNYNYLRFLYSILYLKKFIENNWNNPNNIKYINEPLIQQYIVEYNILYNIDPTYAYWNNNTKINSILKHYPLLEFTLGNLNTFLLSSFDINDIFKIQGYFVLSPQIRKIVFLNKKITNPSIKIITFENIYKNIIIQNLFLISNNQIILSNNTNSMITITDAYITIILQTQFIPNITNIILIISCISL